jgi:hypothetical protein
VTRRGVRTLEFELHRLVNAERASDKKRRGGYSDADRSRVSRLFEYTYTWRNITKIAFVGKWIEFQFGQNKEYTPHRLGFIFPFLMILKRMHVRISPAFLVRSVTHSKFQATLEWSWWGVSS